MAEASRRVLLIDLSSRRPGIETCFKLEPHVGLAELLEGGCTPDEAIRPTAIEHLAILGPGLETEGLAGRLASREMVRFLEWAEEEFDHVVMDTPPALLMSDVKLIAPLVDAVLVIVGAGISTQGMVRRCLREMEQTGANLVGVVLNRVRGAMGGYLRDNLKLYQAYSGNGGNGKVNGGIRDIKITEEESAIVLLPYDRKGHEKDA
jgi:capsular exopolysaccharide synthesis family protein